MAVITYSDLQRFMNHTFDTGQRNAATTILASLERHLAAYLNRPLSPVQIVDEEHRLLTNQRQIFLRKAPVIEVTDFSVGLDGAEVVQDIEDFYIYPWGIDNIRITGDGYRALVTYTAGMLATEAEDLSFVLYSAAAREMNKVLIDAQGLSRLDVENSEYHMANFGYSTFTQDELRMASRSKRRVIR